MTIPFISNRIVYKSPLWEFQAQFDRENAARTIWQGLEPLIEANGVSGNYKPDWTLAQKLFNESKPFPLKSLSAHSIKTAAFVATYLRSKELEEILMRL